MVVGLAGVVKAGGTVVVVVVVIVVVVVVLVVADGLVSDGGAVLGSKGDTEVIRIDCSSSTIHTQHHHRSWRDGVSKRIPILSIPSRS